MSAWHWPAEWEPHAAIWLGWPSHPDLWEDQLAGARQEVADLCAAILDYEPSSKHQRGEDVVLFADNGPALEAARSQLAGLPIHFHEVPFGDIWFRDTAPILGRNGSTLTGRRFRFNGWGGKYAFAPDLRLAEVLGQRLQVPLQAADWVLEGGAVENDGAGTILTTRQCLLNPNRNPTLSEATVEARLAHDLGARKVLWLDEGLAHDHTDGHIDNLARFVAPGEVVCMHASGGDDPNHALYPQVEAALRQMTDAEGRPLRVHSIPSPGKVLSAEGAVMPASYMNFLITNRAVIVPTYGTAQDRPALLALQRLFPRRALIGLSAWSLLHGGGAFHCITQQVPLIS